MGVTIYDVAKKAGVGIGTVSRALNNSPKILPETKARILQIANELQYQPHALAQSLARRKTGTIAVVVPFFMTYFFVEMLRGIQHELTKSNYDLILYSVDNQSKISQLLKRTLEERRVDGVLLCSLPIDTKFAKKFISTGLPIVLVDCMNPLLDSIIIENDSGAYIATRQLIQAGHHKIGMINGKLSSQPASLRLEGFRRALQDFNIPFQEKFLVLCEETEESDGFTREAGYHAMLQLIEMGDEGPSGIFIASDIQAIGAIQALKQRDKIVPRDFSIVSFDDIEIAEFFGLTTMRQPIYEMGRMAVKRLMARIEGTARDSFFKKIEPTLIVRESCAKFAAL